MGQTDLNRAKAIEINRAALLRIVEALFALVGLAESETVTTLPRHLRNHVLRILRPAESAVRRLIIIAAWNIAAPTLSPRGRESLFLHLRGQRPRKCLEKASEGDGMVKTANTFPLLDPLKTFNFGPPKRYATTLPRVRSLSDWSLPVYMRLPEPPARREPSPDDDVDATRLCRRLHTLKRALDDLDGQARRLARWKARRKLGLNRSKRFSPMRPGWPPGRRKRRFHEVDDVLAECHSLAVYAMKTPDTS